MRGWPTCGAQEARLAIAAAHEAFGAWAETPPVEKARLFFNAAEIVRRRGPQVAGILARETGSTIPFSTFHTAAAANEETFGPLVLVDVVDTAEQAVEVANRTPVRVDLNDSGRRHLQGIRVGTEDPARHRQRELADSE